MMTHIIKIIKLFSWISTQCAFSASFGLALAVAVQWYGRRRDRAELFKELLWVIP